METLPPIREPIDVLRTMQLVARLDVPPSVEAIEAARRLSPVGLSRERQFAEWSRLLTAGVRISRGLDFLRVTGWVNHYPELARLIGCRQDPQWHPEGDVWNHTLCCLDAFAQSRPCGVNDPGFDVAEEQVVGFAVLCHDFGKPLCTRYDPVRRRIRSLGHDEEGVAPTLSFLRRLTDDARLLRDVPPLVRLHMRPYAMWRDRSSDGAIRRVMAKVGRIDRLIRVAAADDAGRPPFPSEPEPLRWLAEQAERIRAADAVPKPIVQGRDLVALGLRPGVRLGQILKAAYAAQLNGQFSSLDGGLAFVRARITAEASGGETSVE